jgi:hypothetical protein
VCVCVSRCVNVGVGVNVCLHGGKIGEWMQRLSCVDVHNTHMPHASEHHL